MQEKYGVAGGKKTKSETRERKKAKKMAVSGKSVFKLKEIIIKDKSKK